MRESEFSEATTMKGVVFLGDRKLELREFPDPTPGSRDVILEINAGTRI
jgi:D-arabinose 1-dehydrogenase-like Zn-dependent alcohol dehydrogenase